MSNYKVSQIYFKEGSEDIEKEINRAAETGWKVVAISTYSKGAIDTHNKSHAVVVFSKD